MERAQRGHNSQHFDEELREDIETVLSDDHEKLFHFAKWHIDDYIAGTVGMKLETEGAYIRFLMRLYQRGKPLPDDDRFMATVMNLSIRVWKRIKDSLISIGKIVQKAGCLTNSRFERERKARAEQLQKQAEAARERWKRERAQKAESDSKHANGKNEVSSKFGESFGEVSQKLPANGTKKPNEINEGVVKNHMPLKNQEPISFRDIGSLVDIYTPSEPLKPIPEMKFRPRIDGLLEFTEKTVSGPGFVLDLQACALEVQMCSMPVDRTPAIVEIIARDWAANRTRPKNPGTWFRNALVSRRNQTAIDLVRLQKGVTRASEAPEKAQLRAAYERVQAKKKAQESA